MRARFLALGVILAWPSFAHANWLDNTIGHPIANGLAQGAHVFKDTMVTGAKQTGAAFGSAAHGVGIDRPQSNREPPFDANAASPADKAQSDGSAGAPARSRAASKVGRRP
jgi:hypothetical protein